MNSSSKPRVGRALFALVVCISMLWTAVLPAIGPVVQAAPPSPSKVSLEPVTADELEVAARGERAHEGTDIYLVRLQDPPLASYRGGIQGLAATSPAATGARGLDLNSPAVVAYTAHLAAQRAQALSSMRQLLSRDLEVVYEYYAANNGMAVVLTADEAAAVAKLPEVRFIQRNFERELHTDAGPEWIGAPAIWDGTATGGMPGSQGEGMVVGVIDTGINHDNPSFAEVGPVDGYVHVNPLGSGNFIGYCVDNPWFCNDKLIGARGYPTVGGGNPEDTDGHGSHTASTAAGNVVDATVNAPTTTWEARISGVAPHANIIAYNACCTVAALSAAIDHIVVDYATILQSDPNVRMAVNYSIGSAAPSNLWNDWDTVGYLAARDAGIFVATSAGNAGPGPNTIGSPGDAPWILTVGSSTHDRKLANYLVDMTGPEGAPGNIEGTGLTSGYGPAPIVYAGDYPNPNDPNNPPQLCGAPYPAGTFNGEIVVCDRGVFGRVAKSQNVAAGGAGGYVLVEDVPNVVTLAGDAYAVPGLHITYEDGQALKAWLQTGTPGEHMGTIAGFVPEIDPGFADIVSGFSSRGANRALPGIIVPDVVAPGSAILAAYRDPEQFNVIQGTSMASPHAAGAATLLMAVRPEWSPAEVQSALMLTAHTGVRKEDGVTPADPFDMGSGRVDLNVAALSGLVMHETTANYLGANPEEGGDPNQINIASVGNGDCLQTCTWTRRVRSTADEPATWTVTTNVPAGMTLDVEPANFTLQPGETQVLTITANTGNLPVGEWLFGQIWLTGWGPELHMPVAVRPTAGVLPGEVVIHTRRDAGSQLVTGLETIEATDLTADVVGLARADLTVEALEQDPTRDDPYDQFEVGVFYNLYEVPAGTAWLIAEIVDTTSPDIDLFVGRDVNGDGIPQAGEQICASTSPASAERCNIADPEPGTYWVLVQNWNASANPPDVTTLAVAIVPAADMGNMWVEGPTAVGAGEPYDVRVYWNDPDISAGDYWYGAISLGTDPGSPGNIGTIPVKLIRHADDVIKTGPEQATYGDVITYTISVLPNVTPVDLTYHITDVIPAGTTYVEGSATATEGNVAVTDGVLSWTGVMEVPASRYVMTTSQQSPECAMPFANQGAYLDLTAFGIGPNPAIEGDTVWYTWTTSGVPPSINYYGNEVGNALHFTDDGFAFFNPSTPGSTPWDNMPIPHPAEPNNMLAIFWKDMEIVYSAAQNRGVSLVNLTSGGQNVAHILDYRNLQEYQNPAATYSFQAMITRAVDDSPGAFEIVYAYNNLNGPLSPLTIGLENMFGTEGVQYTYNDPDVNLENGMAICFDWVPADVDPVQISFQVTVNQDAPSVIINTVEHITDNPGSVVETAEVLTEVGVPTSITTGALSAATGNGAALPLLGLGLAFSAMAGIAFWRRRR
jgi:uncharacterized repeat protein (TIGR01451 family)